MINNAIRKKTRLLFISALSALLFSFFISCNSSKNAPIITEEAQEQKQKRHDLTFLAAGDNLFHDTILAAYKQPDGSYNFDSIYTEITDIIQSADLAFINQETVMAGTEFGYSGWPTFNSPQSLAYTLKNAGFDIMNIANNHTMDKGRAGLYSTLDFLDTINDITVLGARKSGVSFRIAVRNNIILGFLSYTYGLNGFTLPAGEPNLVSLINKPVMTEEINRLRPLCDFLIVSMHWGAEYGLIEPDNYQKDLAKFLAEHNVDLIIGHHPHVLQRVETLPRPDGGETLCYYSLGNFVSNQSEKDRLLGGIMAVTFSKEFTDEGEKLSLTDNGLIPTITHIEADWSLTKLYPFYGYTEELLKRHAIHLRDNTMTLEYYNDVLNRLNTKILTNNPF